MADILYPPTSPYYSTSIALGNYLDVMKDRAIPKLIDDVFWTITIAYDTRPDLLAYDLYQDARLWWVFANRNPNTLADPLFDFTTGAGIFLPKVSTLKQVLGL